MANNSLPIHKSKGAYQTGESVNYFLPHLFMEIIHSQSPERHGVLLESTTVEKNRAALLEKYGIFPECDGIVSQIAPHLKEKHSQYDTVSVEINGSAFLESVTLLFFGDGGMSYLPDFTSVGPEGKFKSVVIKVGAGMETDDASLLMHELQHVYEDWKLRLNGTSLDDELTKHGYEKSLRTPGDTALSKMVKDLFYFLNKPELNAYIAKMSGSIKATNQHFMTVMDLFDYVKDFPVYKKYMQVIDSITQFCGLTGKHNRELVLKEANKITGGRFGNYRQFSSWLRRKGLKTKKKLDSILCKAVYDKFYDRMAKAVSAPSGEMLGPENHVGTAKKNF